MLFDTGPGNMVVDALIQQLFQKPYDRSGKTAAQGSVLDSALAAALEHPFFQTKPPKSAGREEFRRRICRGVLEHLPEIRRFKRGRNRNRNRAHRREHYPRLRAICPAEAQKQHPGRLHCLRRRREKQNAHRNVAAKAPTARLQTNGKHRRWNSCRCKRSGGLCPARLLHMASPSGNFLRHRRKAPGYSSGANQLCLRS